MNIMKLLLIFTMLGLLVGCAQLASHPMDMVVAIHNAKTKTDHEALAVHYEQIAYEMKAKSDDHKKQLGEYQAILSKADEQYAQFEAHCLQLIKIYANSEQENLEMARLHRQMASGLLN
ncbi:MULTISPECIES: hypothetical protein [Methylomonas]|uniref:hypothetical protein n=1 Tax=Methylomonas TaxID=416 RepID=UPI0007C911F2|nr:MULTISPECIES: hypothetical protein [Methylomonas]ANE56719.1 hypothetical protein AYM39_17080 [Methylomonas sp. DH-1]WNB75926.1 hypothetical protein RI210_22060 [Methylomonas koyamae]